MASEAATRTPETSQRDAARATARLVHSLRDAACYPHPTGEIAVLETHISYVILTGPRAYKLKKPLHLDFLDFTALASRRSFCEDELRLNRRTAPDLYLRVVPITGTPDAPRIDGTGEAIEYAVEMRQFDPEALLARRVERGEVDGELVDALADRVAAFHAELALAPTAPPILADDGRPSAASTVRRNLAQILALAPPPALRARLETLAVWLEATLARLSPTLLARERGGFVRDCHGDLHLANVALVDGRPVLFDCLEFDALLRWIDVIDEVAFAFMDFQALGRRDLAHRFANRYLEATGDYEGAVGLRFFAVHRALVRAKVAMIRQSQPGLDAQAADRLARELERHLEVAESLAARKAPRLVITCGLAGSGKTTVSGALVEALAAIRIRSDVERKRLAGLAADARSGSPIGAGLYAREGSARTYARLELLARGLLESGQSVIIDAAFLTRRERERFRALARMGGFEFLTVVCQAPVEVLRSRIEARGAKGRDASEADAAVLAHQLTTYEAPAQDELPDVVVIATDRPPAEVSEACRAIGLRSR